MKDVFFSDALPYHPYQCVQWQCAVWPCRLLPTFPHPMNYLAVSVNASSCSVSFPIILLKTISLRIENFKNVGDISFILKYSLFIRELSRRWHHECLAVSSFRLPFFLTPSSDHLCQDICCRSCQDIGRRSILVVSSKLHKCIHCICYSGILNKNT